MTASFRLEAECPRTNARAGSLQTPHGTVDTPLFMPVGTQATVKAITPEELHGLGAGMILANTYHLYLRPGVDLIRRFGGLHAFMGWNDPVLTDSGGYQVFSLAHLRRVTDDGAVFRSHIDGSEHLLTPEAVVEAQEALGADIAMAFDECPPYVEDRRALTEATKRTHVWAGRCRDRHSREDQALFGIVQGGTYLGLRRESAEQITSLDFDGYALGGLSLGEPKEVTFAVVQSTAPLLPADRPRYLMGVGSPEDLIEGIAHGMDMFDSALPTRLARNGALFTRRKRVNVLNSRFRGEGGPIETECDCYTCRNFSLAYLHHLFKSRELLAYTLATIHNLRFVIRLMDEVREAIVNGSFADFRAGFLAQYEPTDETVRAEQKRRWLKSRQSELEPQD